MKFAAYFIVIQVISLQLSFAFNPNLLDVRYFDNDIVVVNKPPNVLSVPGTYDKFSLAKAVAETFHIERIDKMIVHRLDYATSGIIIYALNESALKSLHYQFRMGRSVFKIYNALVYGKMSTFEGLIDLPIGKDIDRGSPFCKVDATDGKKSLTEWNVIGFSEYSSQVRLRPLTGRTHQLRIHMAALGHPILGDLFYAHSEAKEMKERLTLHAEELRFLHPRTLKPMHFNIPSEFNL